MSRTSGGNLVSRIGETPKNAPTARRINPRACLKSGANPCSAIFVSNASDLSKSTLMPSTTNRMRDLAGPIRHQNSGECRRLVREAQDHRRRLVAWGHKRKMAVWMLIRPPFAFEKFEEKYLMGTLLAKKSPIQRANDATRWGRSKGKLSNKERF